MRRSPYILNPYLKRNKKIAQSLYPFSKDTMIDRRFYVCPHDPEFWTVRAVSRSSRTNSVLGRAGFVTSLIDVRHRRKLAAHFRFRRVQRH